MKDYIKYIKSCLNQENQYSCFGFSYMFDLNQGFPNFDNLFELNQLAGPDHHLLTNEQAEIDAHWLLSGDKDLDLLHQQNAYWRDYLGFKEDYTGSLPLSLEERANLAIAKLKEENDVEFKNINTLMSYLIETHGYPEDGNLNTLMDKINIPAEKRVVIHPKGTVGDTHGVCFSAVEEVNVHFQSSAFSKPNLFGSADLDSRANAMSEGKLSYTPNPVILSTIMLEMTQEERIEYLTGHPEHYSELLVDLDNWSKGNDTPSGFKHFMEEQGIFPVKGEPIPTEWVLAYADQFQKELPSKAVVAFLTLTEFDPVIDFGREVLSFLKCLEQMKVSSDVYYKGLGLFVHHAYFKDDELGVKLIDHLEQ